MRRSELRLLWYVIICFVGIVAAALQKPFLGRSRCVKDRQVDIIERAKHTLESVCIDCQVAEFFAPRSDLKPVLLGLVMTEKKKLQLAAFKLTDLDLAKELIAAHERGVAIEIVVDSGGLDTRTGQVVKLHSAGIPVYVYPDPSLKLTSRFSIMHNKFLICYSSLVGGMAVWTGSFNFTKAAAKHNRENVVVIMSEKIARSYAAEFEVLKGECKKL
ncbi:TPA: hypothetical protein DDZ86_00020 [Candidatus Dependentiae bacterium]|nr:MAG: hypothetical protein UW09_C0002G0114 [candidate division TM6 bacterium GW2011_GWF2_43_87]HBL98013.1 hypothetical protein [Candidatus Dependentiae bacterium]